SLLLLILALSFFLNVTATTEIYTLSLHDALPICVRGVRSRARRRGRVEDGGRTRRAAALPVQVRVPRAARIASPEPREPRRAVRSEEHTSELQSLTNLVCRLLLEKKKK